MSKLIAGVYEINDQIGSGGGGIVYIGRHTRLNKIVVLKADKRKLSASKATLRREVDMLKELSHTYIPQVYDFVEEDGSVYTVMDYIEGMSFDKILKAKGKQNQKDVIKWACQLLEALNYLHKTGRNGILHGDIKPANIMLKENGDICLIDFNIALSLGEDGAVSVGFSRGYASPEHYGIEFNDKMESIIRNSKTEIITTEIVDDPKTEIIGEKEESSNTVSKRIIRLDVRSDIYSLGATLYHMISGIKPNAQSENVKALGKDVCSLQLSAILEKAMQRDPSKRYQSAEEMLFAFLNLRKEDPRVKTRKRVIKVAGVLFSLGIVIGSSFLFLGLKQEENRQKALTFAAYAEERFEKGDIDKAIDYALKAIPDEKNIMEGNVTPEAKLVLSKVLGVYDLTDGFRDYKTIELNSSPVKFEISPNGKKCAVLSAFELSIIDFDSGEITDRLPLYSSVLCDCKFLDDETIIYSGENGVQSYQLVKKKALWIGKTGKNLRLSEDKTTVAVINTDGNGVILYNSDDGNVIKTIEFDNKKFLEGINEAYIDPKNYVFEINKDASWLAVSFQDGKLQLFNLKNDESYDLLEDEGRVYTGGGFKEDYLLISSGFKGLYDSLVVNLEEFNMTEGKLVNGRFQNDSSGLYILESGKITKLDIPSPNAKDMTKDSQAMIVDFHSYDGKLCALDENNVLRIFNMAGLLIDSYQANEKIDYLKIGKSHIILGSKDSNKIQILKNFMRDDKDFVKYDVEDKHFEARVSEEENRFVLFIKEKFYIYNLEGEKLYEEVIPDSENSYNTLFVRDPEGSYLKVLYKDGLVRKYSLKDGTLRDEIKGDKPDSEIRDEFETEKYKFVGELNQAIKVYDKQSGKLIKKLEFKDGLHYVTEHKSGIIIEYITSELKTYGYLYDENFDEIAYFPNLSDAYKDELIFDNGNGVLRKEKIYSLEELVRIAKSRKE